MNNSTLQQSTARNIFIIGVAFILAFWYSYSGHSLVLPLLNGPSMQNPLPNANQPVKVVSEESLTVDTVKQVGPSVVTIEGTVPESAQQNYAMPFFYQQTTQPSQIIGSGFIVSSSGLIVTNKHVVSDSTATYQVITADDKKYDVQNIYRDPQNDIAVLKVNPSQNNGSFKAVTLGDSSNLQVGQYVIAIGTALGQFRNTVTTGIISGLGRGIQAGDMYQGEAEDLNGLIQTNAAINPGNSGGPLINDNDQVIGINTAVAAEGQNIGFALPVNIVKSSLSSYNIGL